MDSEHYQWTLNIYIGLMSYNKIYILCSKQRYVTCDLMLIIQ